MSSCPHVPASAAPHPLLPAIPHSPPPAFVPASGLPQSLPAASPHISPPGTPHSPLPGFVPAPGTVPQFPPLRIRGGRYRAHWSARRRRRALAAGLAMTAAALAASGFRGSPSPVEAPAAVPRPVAARPSCRRRCASRTRRPYGS